LYFSLNLYKTQVNFKINLHQNLINQNLKIGTLLLKNKNIVLIGGTTGLGLSASKAFVKNGAKIVAVGLDAESCQATENLLGEQCICLCANATDPKTAQTAINICKNAYGSFDGLYHVAGGSGRKQGDGPLHDLTLDGWNYTMNLNLTSLMLSNQAAVQHFLEEGKSGTILNMGSVLGIAPAPQYFATHAYATAKSAILGFTKSVAAYYAKDNIRINVLAPALVATPMSQRASTNPEIMDFVAKKQPLDGGRNGLPQDLDGAAVFFMSDVSGFCTGQSLFVDGGWSVS
jgi:NAD(P)-dependent dehydrogenase (short-subunit alcohol dehydrogenase family)